MTCRFNCCLFIINVIYYILYLNLQDSFVMSNYNLFTLLTLGSRIKIPVRKEFSSEVFGNLS